MPTDNSIATGELAESASDEADIINDQDETEDNSPRHAASSATDRNVGTDSGEFVRGEVDLVDQMSRVTSQMDRATGRTDDPFEGYDTRTPNDDAQI